MNLPILTAKPSPRKWLVEATALNGAYRSAYGPSLRRCLGWCLFARDPGPGILTTGEGREGAR